MVGWLAGWPQLFVFSMRMVESSNARAHAHAHAHRWRGYLMKGLMVGLARTHARLFVLGWLVGWLVGWCGCTSLAGWLAVQFPDAVLREIKILRQLRFHVNKPHPNIIMLRNIVLHRQKGVPGPPSLTQARCCFATVAPCLLACCRRTHRYTLAGPADAARPVLSARCASRC